MSDASIIDLAIRLLKYADAVLFEWHAIQEASVLATRPSAQKASISW